MANSEKSKIKILFLYDFFMKRLIPDETSVSMAELLNILEKECGERFERKSVYADIAKLNDYMRESGRVKGEWIYTEKKRYKVAELKSQISLDEAHLLVDAVRTTAFVDSDISGKIMELYPAYFKDRGGASFLASHDHKSPRRLINVINNFRTAIDNREVVTFSYGYKLGKALAYKTQRTVSPLKLDWRNNIYYLIALDNDICDSLEKSGKPLDSAMRRFRVDRIESTDFTGERYRDFPNAKMRQEAIDNEINNSVNAFYSQDLINVEIKLNYIADDTLTNSEEPRKAALRAFNILSDKVTIKTIVSDLKLGDGELIFIVETADAPTFYSYLFQAGNVDGIKLQILNEDVRRKYASFLENALKAL